MPTLTIQQALDLALQHHRAGRLVEAEAIYRQILAQQPSQAGAHHLLGLLAAERGQLEAAMELIQKAIAINPAEPVFYINLARALGQAGRIRDSIPLLKRALELSPNDPQVHYDLGVALQAAGQFPESIQAYQKALHLRPGYAEAHNNIGSALNSLGRQDEAATCFQKALQLNPSLLEAYGNLGALCEARGQFEQAIELYHQALAINPDHPQIHYNLGVALGRLERWGESIAAYRRAIQLKPDFPDALFNLGNALRGQGLIDEAVAAFSNVLQRNPDNSLALNNLGIVLDLKGERDEAIACYRKAVALQPDDAAIHSNLVYSLHFHPAWDPAMLLQEHRAWNRQHAEPFRSAIQPHSNDRSPDQRIRIGYISPDLRDHVVGRFMLPLLAAHDHGAFEVFCYADGGTADSLSERLRTHADHWLAIHGLSDEQVAARIRQDGIDILIDLTMHMRGNRLLVFARKPAPIQVTYLAYCSTTGLQTMDYRITDPCLDPPDMDTTRYTEQTMRVESYWCYAASPESAEVNELPALGSGRITFGCLNNFCKVSPDAAGTWARLLLAVPDSRLLLHANPGSHQQRFKESLAAQGIDPARREFVGLNKFADYFKLYHRIDIALDPFPYAGGTTTCDALWMGVPVITLAGKTAVGRGGVSILSTLGLPELIARDETEYIAIASSLARDLPRLQALRAGLRQRMLSSPLMDAPGFARNMEAAYRQMWHNWCSAAPSIHPLRES